MANTTAIKREIQENFDEFTLAGPVVGIVYYVSSVTGSSGYAGRTADRPLATIAAAYALAVAGDTIVVLPGHAETTTAFSIAKAGITVKGIGNGRARPAFTATTAATDLFSIDAANVRIENIRFVGAASGNTALLNVAGDDCFIERCQFEADATPLMSVTIASGHRGTIQDCQWRTSANGPDCAIDIESSDSDYWRILNCSFVASAGWDLGVIRANVDNCLGWRIADCTFIKCDTVAIDFNSSASVSDGIVQNCTFLATAALTSIEDIIDAGGYSFRECYAHDGTNATTAMARVPIGTVS